MPIKLENRSRYPKNWTSEIRPAILERAHHRCEHCRVPNYALGYRDGHGNFIPARGNVYLDAMGCGLIYPSGQRSGYQEVKHFADALNDNGLCDGDGYHWFVIVLTIAHLNHHVEDCDASNLKALCQRCHLHLDADLHRLNAQITRHSRKACGDLFGYG